MIFIVEGIDRVGKSTFCEKYAKLSNAVIFKDTYYDDTNMNAACGIEKLQTTLNMLVALDLKNINVVVDRYYLTEIVYGAKSRGYLNADAISFDKELAGKLEGHVCLILVEPTNINRSSEEHGSDLSAHEELFQKLYDESSISLKLKINYSCFDVCMKVLEAWRGQ